MPRVVPYLVVERADRPLLPFEDLHEVAVPVDRVTCDLGDMPVGSKEQRKIVVEAQKAGTVSLQGCAVKSGTPDCNPSNNRLGSAGARSAGGEQSQPVSGVGPQTTVVNVKEGSS